MANTVQARRRRPRKVDPEKRRRKIGAEPSHRVEAVPANIMAELRAAATSNPDGDDEEQRESASQVRTAQLLGVGRRTLQGWEMVGASLHCAYALVGLGFRMGGQERGLSCLEVLAQLELVEGARVAARREQVRAATARWRERQRAG